MSEEKEPTIGLDIEEQPEGPFDLLRLTLPLPRLMFLPKEAREHLRTARREQLLALRSLLDTAIEQLEKEEKPRHKAERVEVE
ncbi:MAG TPA: hypothetical protein PKM21_11530 [Anaerolineales bacterium]|nr:hypothetical protein [Anaerolineales bacterium]